MDGAFFVSRSELLSWANGFFQMNLTKVEQCCNGAVYCQVVDACHPGQVAMKKVNWGARAEHESIPNFKVLQQAFDRCGITRHIEVDKLVRGRYQDNLEMLQWIKTYFDRSFPGGEYDALARRFTENNLPEWARPGDGTASAPSRSIANARGGGTTAPSSADGRPPKAAAGRGRGAAMASEPRRASPPAGQQELDSVREEHDKLREEVVDLKITVDGLETERDFYFQKLRDIEILCQTVESSPDPSMTVAKFVENVQKLLYAKDEEEEEEAEDKGKENS